MPNIIGILTGLIISVIETTGYAGIFLLMTAESALIPIPSEITMPFSGFLVSRGDFNLFLVIAVGAAANLFGSLLAFWLGFSGGETTVRTAIRRWGKYVLVDEHELDRSEKWFRKYGQRIVFFSRILPIVRTFISLPAGIAKMNVWKFAFYTTLGSLLWSGLLTYIGLTLGKNWHNLEVYYRKFETLIIIVGAVLFVWYVWRKFSRRRKKSSLPTP